MYLLMKVAGIFTQRYFYPLISTFPMYRGLDSAKTENLPESHIVAESVLCLPIYADLQENEQRGIIDLIHSIACQAD
uniref:DegT/DnrJ/EryC1/StrS family aminotransferase n=1 Tax=Pectobacterium peruviense TaxID=2066479 RepID=UPI003F60250E